MNVRAAVCLSVCLVAALAVTCWADEGPPDPISLDRQSPSVVVFQSTPDDIYDMPNPQPMPPAPPMGFDAGGPGPVVHVVNGAYVLNPGADNNDGHSNGEVDLNGEVNPDAPLSIYFSGDDMSVGAPKTDYNHQAIRLQAAGDRFMANGLTSHSPVAALAGGLGPAMINGPIFAGGLGNFPQNVLSANQHRYNEIPSIGPAAFNTYVPPVAGATQTDDMDALELTPFDLNGDLIHETPIYFSLDPMSPTLGAFGASPADILVAPPTIPVVGVFAPAAAMGLMGGVVGGDDIDALVVWDVGQDLQVVPGLDYALFSLVPGSPSLAAGFSPADIFVTDFNGGFMPYLWHFDLGMLPTDNIDALDVESNILQEPLDWVAGQALPGDYNGDGIIDAADYTVWRDNRGNVGMPGIPGDGDDGSLTGNPDGIVDEADYMYWKVNYASVAYGCGSIVGPTVPEPASVVLVAMAAIAFGLTAVRRRQGK